MSNREDQGKEKQDKNNTRRTRKTLRKKRMERGESNRIKMKEYFTVTLRSHFMTGDKVSFTY